MSTAEQLPEPLEEGKRPFPVKVHIDNVQDGTRVDDRGISRATIPLALLALSKDDRYLQHGAELLQGMVMGWGVTISPALCKVLSTIIFFLPLIPKLHGIPLEGRPSGTHGMAACAVGFAEKNGGTKLAFGSIAMAMLYYAAEFYEATILLADEVTRSNERLKGKSRLEKFERQRKDMVDRLGGNGNPPSPTDEKSWIQTWRQAILKGLIKAFKAANSTPPGFGGPHMRTRDESWEISAPSSIAWLLRLHFAIYLLTGKYPTILHRILRLQLRNKSPNHYKAASVGSYDMEYVMGALLAGFSLGALIKISSQALFGRIQSLSNRTDDSAATRTAANTLRSSSDATKFCMICAGERKHPSCPVQCGHLFCWTCLHKWIQNQSEACPFCRTPCSSKDIVCLRNYA